jgi:glyoxylase-like metal-dependent hydrolase (beta-lactamase superfamily II)
MPHSISKDCLLFLVFCISPAPKHGLATELKAMALEPGLTCLQDPLDSESSNSFLIQSRGHSLLIDAGWSSKAKIPSALAGAIGKAVKVATHFHYDHIRRWNDMAHIVLSPDQSTGCGEVKCKLGIWKSINSIKEFRVESEYQFDQRIGRTELIPIRCEGHSNSDACFVDPVSKTLFLGDLFYLGPVFYFLPGGSLRSAISALNELLKRQDWDQVALTHGSCVRVDRQTLAKYVGELTQIEEGKIKGSWNFAFWIPLRAYDISTGTIFLRPIFR